MCSVGNSEGSTVYGEAGEAGEGGGAGNGFVEESTQAYDLDGPSSNQSDGKQAGAPMDCEPTMVYGITGVHMYIAVHVAMCHTVGQLSNMKNKPQIYNSVHVTFTQASAQHLTPVNKTLCKILDP